MHNDHENESETDFQGMIEHYLKKYLAKKKVVTTHTAFSPLLIWSDMEEER